MPITNPPARCWPVLIALVGVLGCTAPRPDRYAVTMHDGTVQEVRCMGMEVVRWGKVLCTYEAIGDDVCWPLESVKEWRRIP